ncbi:MAG: glutamine-hydrolyzing carbamoyl-phosphate synthase small subunit [Thermoproteales archaeon]|nr:glutamine-hydrolyzing carbamoyl-phosphate synthase small subunit [Thermoproteales archaeon]
MHEETTAFEALLLLEDGSIFRGKGFGAEAEVIGEVVFTTGMVGYTEALTDPSYRGQILTFTYPLIGNYGVPPYSMVDDFNLPLHFESEKIQVEGVVVHEACFHPNHWASVKNIHEWLREEGKPGIHRIDTRRLVKILRERGVMMGILKTYRVGEEVDLDQLFEKLSKAKRYEDEDLVDKVSPTKIIIHRPLTGGKRRIVVLDCGVKLSIVRRLLELGFTVLRVPYNYPVDKIIDLEPSGVLVSNGPGDPRRLSETIRTVKSLMEYGFPILGICLGCQLIAISAGATVFKLPYGHRGQNKACMELPSGQSYITSQNHGYAVSKESLSGIDIDVWFVNVDDGTIEGVLDPQKRFIGVQFHPEAAPGPYDTLWIFKVFSKKVDSFKF